MGSKKDGFQITVGTLPMENKAICVYFGEFQSRVTTGLIKMSNLVNVIKNVYTKGNASNR